MGHFFHSLFPLLTVDSEVLVDSRAKRWKEPVFLKRYRGGVPIVAHQVRKPTSTHKDTRRRNDYKLNERKEHSEWEDQCEKIILL